MRTEEPESLVAASPVELARIVTAGWRIVLGAVVAVVLPVALYLYFVAEKKYTATGTIMIEPPASLYPSTPGVAEPANLDKSAIISQAEALRSRDLLQTVGKKLQAEGLPGADAAVSQDSTVEHLQDALSISVVDDSRVITAELTDARPEVAGRALTLLFNEYIQREVDRRESINAAARDQYAARSASLRSELESLNRQIAAQTSKTGRHFEGGTTILFGSMQTAVNQLDDLQGQLADVNSKIRVVNDAMRNGDGAVAAAILETPTMKKLVQNQVDLELEEQAVAGSGKGYEHPDARGIRLRKASLANLMKDQLRQAQRELNESRAQLLGQARELQLRISTLQTGSDLESEGTATLDQLEKSATALREMLNQVVGRLYDTAVAPSANAWIIASPAVLPNPTSPRIPITLVGATLLGLIGGALVTFWREGKLRAARAVLEIYPAAAMPSLWSLPPPRHKLLVSPSNSSLKSVRRQGWHETLRAIGRRLALKSSAGRGVAVAVVSAQPREGKTMVALTLARTLANDGFKVLLVDGDLRKPDIHQCAHMHTDGSLYSLLRSAPDWLKLVKRDPSSPLHLVAPSEPSDPSTGFLRDGRIRAFLDSAQQQYDFVVIDTSPVLRVADGLFFLDFVESAILVSGENTDPRETQRVLAQPGFPLDKVEGVIRFGRGVGMLSYPGY